MAIDPFKLPGSDLLRIGDRFALGSNKGGSQTAAPAPVKDKSLGQGGGGGIPKRKPAPIAQEPEEDLVPETPPPAAPKEPPVKLSNLKWHAESAHFGETVSLSADVELPESLKDITRVIVTVYSLPTAKKKIQVKARDLYIKDGKIQGEFELMRPERQDGKEVESCPYVFTAKHRDSKEMESPQLPVKVKEAGNDELILELAESDLPKDEEFTFNLKATNRSLDAKIEVKNGEKKDGKIILKFVKLNPNLKYTLEILDSKQEVFETVFKDVLFGKWT